MLRWIIPLAILIGTIAAVPLAVIARARVSTSEKPRLHGWQDMDNQPRFKAQQANPLYADGRAMRPPVPGTVARGESFLDAHLYQGRVAGKGGKLTWATSFPDDVTVDSEFLARGKNRYDIYCSMCHGYAGQGDGMVHKRVEQRKQAGVAGFEAWAAPASYHTEIVKAQPVGQLYNTITNGKNNMAGYRAQIPVEDRWAITAYVKALQRAKPKQAPEN